MQQPPLEFLELPCRCLVLRARQASPDAVIHLIDRRPNCVADHLASAATMTGMAAQSIRQPVCIRCGRRNAGEFLMISNTRLAVWLRCIHCGEVEAYWL